MTESLVPTVRTSVSMSDYARAIVRAWRIVLGTTPSKASAGVLWAQYGIETGAGPWCWCWNIGNVKHVAGDGHDYMMLANTWEVVNGKRVVFQPPHPATWFRAFASLDDAMVDHLRFLRRRFATSWEGVELGDCGVFARRLKEGRDGQEGTADDYYTADSNAYAAGMRAHFNRWMKSDAFEDALEDLEAATDPVMPDVPPAVSDASLFVEVSVGGQRWIVAPIYIAPIGIGAAAKLAADLGYELPSPDLVDEIWRQADLRCDPERIIFTAADGSDFTAKTMNAPSTHALVQSRIAQQIGSRNLGRDFHLIAGAYKDVCVQDGKLGIYGLHRLDGRPVQGRDANGKIFTGHDPSWVDWSQGLRLVRRLPQ